MSTAGQRTRESGDDRHCIEAQRTRGEAGHVATTVRIAGESRDGDQRREDRNRHPGAERADQRRETAGGRHRVGDNELAGKASHFVAEHGNADGIGRFHEDRVRHLASGGDASADDRDRRGVGRALHRVLHGGTQHALIQRVGDERRDRDQLPLHRVRHDERVEHCHGVLEWIAEGGGILEDVGTGDLVAERAHLVARLARERNHERLAAHHR